jgi:hypothetical protein
MRSFRLPEPVDLVLCEFDALNHVPRKADLARVARAIVRDAGSGNLGSLTIPVLPHAQTQ